MTVRKARGFTLRAGARPALRNRSHGASLLTTYVARWPRAGGMIFAANYACVMSWVFKAPAIALTLIANIAGPTTSSSGTGHAGLRRTRTSPPESASWSTIAGSGPTWHGKCGRLPGRCGRLGAIRFKSRLFDVAIVVVYMPIEQSSERSRRVASDVWRVFSAYLATLAARTVPILLLDTNAHLCVEVVASPHGNIEADTDLPSWGKYGRQLENFNCGLLRQLLARHKLCAPASFFATGAKLYSGKGESVSNIDQVLAPLDFLLSVRNASVLLHEGDRLQIVPCTARRHHRPLAVTMQFRLWHRAAALP